MGNSRNLLNQQNRKPSVLSFQKYSYACYSCGSTEHSQNKCRFRNVVCSRCKHRGHIARVCKKGNMENNRVEQRLDSHAVFSEEELFTVFAVQIENEECCMQLDTGCALSLAPVTFL